MRWATQLPPWAGHSLLRLGLGLGLGLALACLGAPAQSVERGRALYESRCGACHSVDDNRAGPLHAGVLGRRAGSVKGFDYSPALADSRLIWTRSTLLAWLADPEDLIPGQAMGVNVPEAGDRQDLVAYLVSLKPATRLSPSPDSTKEKSP